MENWGALHPLLMNDGNWAGNLDMAPLEFVGWIGGEADMRQGKVFSTFHVPLVEPEIRLTNQKHVQQTGDFRGKQQPTYIQHLNCGQAW